MVGCTEGICGMRPDADGLVISPSIPAQWDGFRMTKKFRGKLLNIDVKNPNHVQSGVASMTVNGKTVEGNKLCACCLEDVNEVEIVLG
jgi:cellobiose phosphorylase